MACLPDAQGMAGGDRAICGYRFLWGRSAIVRWPVEPQRRRDGVHGADAIARAARDVGPGFTATCPLCDDPGPFPRENRRTYRSRQFASRLAGDLSAGRTAGTWIGVGAEANQRSAGC